jgi:hypothetical protein
MPALSRNSYRPINKLEAEILEQDRPYVPIADIRWLRIFFFLINLVGIKRRVFDGCIELKT